MVCNAPSSFRMVVLEVRQSIGPVHVHIAKGRVSWHQEYLVRPIAAFDFSSPTYSCVEDPLQYPLSSPSYFPTFDDAPWVQQELQEASDTWRSEKWPLQSNVLILDHDQGKSTVGHYDDAGLDKLLKEPSPKIRFVLLSPTNQENIRHEITDHKKAETYYSNGLLDKPTARTSSVDGDSSRVTLTDDQSIHQEWISGDKPSAVPQSTGSQASRTREVPSQLNISRRALLKLLTKFDIAPLASSHIRGQEQIFGSRVCRDEAGSVQSFGESCSQHHKGNMKSFNILVQYSSWRLVSCYNSFWIIACACL